MLHHPTCALSFVGFQSQNDLFLLETCVEMCCIQLALLYIWQDTSNRRVTCEYLGPRLVHPTIKS